MRIDILYRHRVFLCIFFLFFFLHRVLLLLLLSYYYYYYYDYYRLQLLLLLLLLIVIMLYNRIVESWNRSDPHSGRSKSARRVKAEDKATYLRRRVCIAAYIPFIASNLFIFFRTGWGVLNRHREEINCFERIRIVLASLSAFYNKSSGQFDIVTSKSGKTKRLRGRRIIEGWGFDNGR